MRGMPLHNARHRLSERTVHLVRCCGARSATVGNEALADQLLCICRRAPADQRADAKNHGREKDAMFHGRAFSGLVVVSDLDPALERRDVHEHDQTVRVESTTGNEQLELIRRR